MLYRFCWSIGTSCIAFTTVSICIKNWKSFPRVTEIYSLIQSMHHMLMGYVWKRSCVAIFFHSTWWIGKWIGISFFIKYLFWIFTAVAEKYNYFIKPHFNFLIFRCFESSIYRGFFRKNWEILFSELVVVHNVSETVIINI